MSKQPFPSVPAMFLRRITSTPEQEAFSFPDANENWESITWQQTGVRVKSIAGGLQALSLGLEDRCSILCNTRVEWILVDLGILCATGATSTIYPSSTAEDCKYIINDSGTRFVFAEDAEQVAKLLTVRDEMPLLEKIIQIDGEVSESNADIVLSLADLERLGDEYYSEHPDAYESRINELNEDHLATLIYTSGTTGNPKGVELLHSCWVFEADAMNRLGFLSPSDVQFLWLPLSHSFGKVLEVAAIHIGFKTAVDGRLDKIVENFSVVKPTFVAAVPRIFEKVYNKVVSGAKDGGNLKYKIFRWALSVGQEVSSRKQRDLPLPTLLNIKYTLATKLVFSKLQALFGGQLRFFISGSAPLSYEIATFFHAAGILILEGYGLTESSAATFVNRPESRQYCFGTVGKPLPGVEYKLYKTEDPEDERNDEILLAGPGIMRGYYNLPAVNAETFYVDENGKKWLRTGDRGREDENGFLKIVDRIKNLIKTSGGKYVAPQKLEGQFKALCPFVSEALVHGDKRNFCSMLVTLNPETIGKWASDAGLTLSYEELTKHNAVHQVVQGYVDQLNEPLAKYETIKNFAILPSEFTIESGELTPSQKLKRKVVEEKYMDVLDGFYTSTLEDM